MQAARRLPPLSLPFALLGLLISHLTMVILQTAVLDEDAHWIGLGVSTAAGLVAGWVVSALPRARAYRAWPYVIVVLTGAVVGMIMQYVLMAREPPQRSYMLSSGITTHDPVVWVVSGAPVGAIPTLALVAVYTIAMRFYSVTPAQDAWERIMAPFAASAALLGALSFALGEGSLRVAAAAIVLVAMGASAEIMLRDRWRAAWLRRVLSGQDPQHELVALVSPQPDVPLAVGNVEPRALVVRVVEHASYRSAARDPVARTTHSFALAVGPLLARRRGLVLAQLAALVVLAVGLVASDS